MGRLAMSLTYRELIENLRHIPDERLDDTVTVYVRGTAEFYPLAEDYPFAVVNKEFEDTNAPGSQESALDDGHAYLII